MATIFRRAGSPYFQAGYFTADGRRVFRSTKKKNRAEALQVAVDLERVAKRTTVEGQERSRRILAILEEAGELAIREALTESLARGFLDRILEGATGERLNIPTIEKWLTDWLGDKKLSRRGATAARYEGVVKAFLEFLPEGKRGQPLGMLSAADIRGFRDQLLAEGRAEATANLAVKILRTPLTVARKQGLISHNPAEAIETVAARSVVKGVFSPADVAKLLAHSTPEWSGLILAGYYTGARIGDLSSLRWESVDLTRLTIAFCQQKTGAPIEIPIHPQLETWLRQWQSEKHDAKVVFPDKAGKTIGGRNGLSGQFRLIMQKARLSGVVTPRKGEAGRSRSSLTFHSLRHSFNSAMANAGVSQEIRQRLTGHAAKGVNDRYTHTELGTLRTAVEAVPNVG